MAVPANKAHGIYLDRAVGDIINNQIQITDYALHRSAIYCASAGEELINLTNNTLDVLKNGVDDPAPHFNYIVGCTIERFRSTDNVIPIGVFDGFDINGLVVEAGD